MQTTTGNSRARKSNVKKIAGSASRGMRRTGVEVKTSLGTLQALIEGQPDLKAGLKQMIAAEKHIYDVSSKQVVRMAKYLKAHWKTVVPALVLLGVGASLLRGGAKKH